MADAKPKPVVVIYVTRDGVETVQVHSPGRLAEREGTALYERIRAIVDRLDRAARGHGYGPDRRWRDEARGRQP